MGSRARLAQVAGRVWDRYHEKQKHAHNEAGKSAYASRAPSDDAAGRPRHGAGGRCGRPFALGAQHQARWLPAGNSRKLIDDALWRGPIVPFRNS
jgi:hypothetical protein